MRADTGIGIREADSAGNDPGRDTNDKVSCDQRATRVSIAHALAADVQGADHVVVHKLTVDHVVAGTAVFIGDGIGIQGLQVVGQRSLMLKY